jgi:predicted metalloprotease with PDZ domain
MEGLTSFYEVVALRRAGLVTPERFVQIWAERATQLFRTPGRLRTPLANASYDAWIKHYRPDETTANTTVSYYLKGSVVGFLLDLEIRRRTGGARSLDDVMRLLFERYGRAPGLSEDGVERTASEVAGEDLTRWFDRALRTTEELDIDGALRGVGLRAVVRPATSADDKGGTASDPDRAIPEGPSRAWFGAQLREKNGWLEVLSVLDGSPAQQAGIGAGDEIAALDGFRSEMQKRLGRASAGQTVRVSLFRFDELIETSVKLGHAPRDTAVFVSDPSASAQQKELRRAWLGDLWPAG